MFSSDQAMANQGYGGGNRGSSIETGTKLYISNLDYGVSQEDIKVNSFSLFVCDFVKCLAADVIYRVIK